MSDPSPYVILDAAGWSVTTVDGDPTNGKIRYAKDDWELRVNWRPDCWFEEYLASRRHISPPGPVTLLGEPAEMWAYHRRDHTVLGPVHGETFLEVRGRAWSVQRSSGCSTVCARSTPASSTRGCRRTSCVPLRLRRP
ncbi:hypothetical protein KRR39_10235 [Nocardioides panacis]|uniref:Uncharacterized protein n=1 Tax=Nocardioides panacis TaxID=2849501 RepID=A0A975Y209_9ACTN|nr:hypothetical protein [Nocardioides panacis]QWZ10071.1 hypothetical protein KRR39_10235 [Nocardioides panacis]